MLGHQRRLGAYIVNYADDFVICCANRAEEAMATMRNMMGRLKLTVNETKTQLRRIPEETFDFLGYTFGRCYWPVNGRAYIGKQPSKKRIARICEAIHAMTERKHGQRDPDKLIADLNRLMIGWANYFSLGAVTKAYKAVDAHACRRLRQWMRCKYKRRSMSTGWYTDAYVHEELGLVHLPSRRRRLSCAKA